jgi:hypothetical protein
MQINFLEKTTSEYSEEDRDISLQELLDLKKELLETKPLGMRKKLKKKILLRQIEQEIAKIF